MWKTILISLCFIYSQELFAQPDPIPSIFLKRPPIPTIKTDDTASRLWFQSVVIKHDTVFETYKYGATERKFIDTGLYISLFSPINCIMSISSVKNNISDGSYISFYYFTNMPEMSGYHYQGLKDKTWYYWDEEGRLKYKEFWDKGVLIKKEEY